MHLKLHIGNKNYSSWSLRPWLLMKMLQIPFEEVHHEFGEGVGGKARFLDPTKVPSPTGQVPCLEWDGHHMIWESLAIVEFLAEEHEAIWPMDKKLRAESRSACAEMHAGFRSLRKFCPMNCSVVCTMRNQESIADDVKRLNSLLGKFLDQTGGPFLCGARFTGVDAFFAPVAFRWQSYQFNISEPVKKYFEMILALPPMQDWFKEAIQEKFIDPEEEPGNDKHLQIDHRKNK